MKSLLTIIVLLCSLAICGQVGIGTETPSPASMLDINSTLDSGLSYQGLLPPRIPLTADLSKINAGVADVGLLVFVNETGCLKIWNGAAWENVYCISLSTTNTVVEYDVLTQTQLEDAGGVSFSFNITDPSPTAPTLVTIEASSYDDLDESASQTIVIPANTANYTASNFFNITDDSVIESTENISFTITAVSGGVGSPSVGTNNIHVLTILDNDSSFTAVAQDFDLMNTWSYSSDVAFFDNGADGFYGIDNGTRLSNINTLSNNFIGTQDLNDEGVNGTPGFATLTFATVNVLGGIGINLSFDYDAHRLDTGDDIYYTVIIDGTPQTEVFLVNGFSNLSVNGTVSVPIPNGTSTVGLTVRFKQNGTDDEIGFDNFTLN